MLPFHRIFIRQMAIFAAMNNAIPTLHFRDASIADLPVIVDIYNSTVSSRMVTADTEKVSLESKVQWFHEHNDLTRPLYVVQSEQEEIIGWLSFQSFYGRPAYNETAEISIYLAETARGRGLGKSVLKYALAKAPELKVNTLLAFIFTHNAPSIKLFQQEGFQDWGNLPDIAVLDGIHRSLLILGRKV